MREEDSAVEVETSDKSPMVNFAISHEEEYKYGSIKSCVSDDNSKDKRIEKVKILIVDDVSMCAKVLQKSCERALRTLGGNNFKVQLTTDIADDGLSAVQLLKSEMPMTTSTLHEQASSSWSTYDIIFMVRIGYYFFTLSTYLLRIIISHTPYHHIPYSVSSCTIHCITISHTPYHVSHSFFGNRKEGRFELEGYSKAAW